MYSTVKRFGPYGCAHRNHFVDTHCRYVHGYGITVTITFQCEFVTQPGFVEDFGDMGEIKKQLARWFDHTLLISEQDPLLPAFQALQHEGGCRVVVMEDSVSMEARAEMVIQWLHDAGWTTAVSVEVREHENNAGVYTYDANA